MSTPPQSLQRPGGTVVTAPPRDRPARTGLVVTLSVLGGLLLAVLWSYTLVDSVIGEHVADGILGADAKTTTLAGTTAGLVFAFVSGLAGTFTACNVAMAASIGPLSQVPQRRGGTLSAFLRPVGFLTLGMVVVSGCYGFIGVLLGDRLPQLSTATVGHLPVRLVQSMVAFGIIGLALLVLGLSTLRVLPDVFANRPAAKVVLLGALIGGFLVGRPYPLFNKLFHWAADTGNPLVGAATFNLQSLGNVALVTVVFAILTLVTRGGFLRMMTATPRRAALVTGSLLIALGVFLVVYWDVRLAAALGYGWFPTMPYN